MAIIVIILRQKETTN